MGIGRTFGIRHTLPPLLASLVLGGMIACGGSQSAAKKDQTGTAYQVGGGAQSQQFGGTVQPDKFGGQTKTDSNVQAAKDRPTGSSGATSQSSLAGLFADGGAAFFDQFPLEFQGNPAIPPMTQWYCGYHDKRFGPLGGGFALLNLDPHYAAGYTLSMRPPASHCTGIGVSVNLVDLSDGHAINLTCHDGPSGKCYKGTFDIPIGSTPSWHISADDLREGTPVGPYVLIYSWIYSTGGSCSGPEKASFGIAIYLSKADGISAPAHVPCPGFP